MLRWLIAVLLLANVLAFALASGMLGPLPSSGPREPNHLYRQIHPEWLKTQPMSSAEASERAIGGAPISQPAVTTAPLMQ
jgi:hypothetical protein